MPNEDTQALIDSIAFQIQTRGSACLRTGKRRTDPAARKILKAGAAAVGCEVSIAKIDGGLSATIKEKK